MEKQAIGGQAVDTESLRAPLLLCPYEPYYPKNIYTHPNSQIRQNILQQSSYII